SASMKKNTGNARISPREKAGETFSVHPNQLYPARPVVDMRNLQHAIQRYADLFDFAPTSYVNFDRSGRIVEINLTAVKLFGLPRERMIGMPFAVFVLREDCPLFLHHLLRCRHAEDRVETELHLKNSKKEIIRAHLCSRALSGLPYNGAMVFQSSIVDLSERKAAEDARAEAGRQQAALYEFAHRRQDAKSMNEVYAAALHAILSALQSNRASILLFDEHNAMRFVAWHGLSKKYRTAVEGHSPWKPGTKNPEPICMPDVETADLPKSLKATIRAEGIHALAFIPLVRGKKVIGKFMTYYDGPHTFSENELNLAGTIARELVQAIEHKRDEQALRDKEAELELIVTETPFMLTRCSRDLRYRYVSRAYAKVFGRTP